MSVTNILQYSSMPRIDALLAKTELNFPFIGNTATLGQLSIWTFCVQLACVCFCVSFHLFVPCLFYAWNNTHINTYIHKCLSYIEYFIPNLLHSGIALTLIFGRKKSGLFGMILKYDYWQFGGGLASGFCFWPTGYIGCAREVFFSVQTYQHEAIISWTCAIQFSYVGNHSWWTGLLFQSQRWLKLMRHEYFSSTLKL